MYENISKCQDVVIISQKIYKFFRVATKFFWMTSLTFALNIVFFPLLKPWQLSVFSLTYSKKHSFFSNFLCWSTCPNLTSPYSLAKDNFKRQWFDKHNCCNILNNLLKKLFNTIKGKILTVKTKKQLILVISHFHFLLF